MESEPDPAETGFDPDILSKMLLPFYCEIKIRSKKSGILVILIITKPMYI